MKYLAILLMLLSASAIYADDPPVADAPALVASKDVPGDGTRQSPYLFSASSKCVIRLTGTAVNPVWDVTDAPPDIEVLGQVAVFSLAEPGTYVVFVRGDTWHKKAWFEIKGPNGPPQPTNALAAKLRTALTGTDSKTDAVQFAAIMRGIADAAEATPPATHKPMKALWDSTLKSNAWPAGKYPLLPDVGRLAIPTANETDPIDATQLAAIVANLRTLQKTAEAIGNGK